ncbi:MAG: hypothetical protein ACI4UY_06935 [Kiritimatiellia bacterium]
MMFMAYLGVIDCVEQMRIANAEAVSEAWQCAFVVGVMAIVLCAAIWAICRMVRRNVRLPDKRVALAILALGTTAWGGPKIVTQKGINLTKCEVDSKKVVLEWSTEDERIRPGAKFMVQALREGSGAYETVATTTASNAVIPRFTVDKTHVWRIAVDAGEVQVDEGGTE